MKELCCTWCGGLLRRVKKPDYAGVDRYWHSCVDCGESGWEYGSPREAYQRRTRLARQRQLTTISGYHAHPEPPDDSICPYCQTGPCVALCEPPGDDAEYVRQFRAGAFDAELVGYSEALGYTLTERLVSGE